MTAVLIYDLIYDRRLKEPAQPRRDWLVRYGAVPAEIVFSNSWNYLAIGNSNHPGPPMHFFAQQVVSLLCTCMH